VLDGPAQRIREPVVPPEQLGADEERGRAEDPESDRLFAPSAEQRLRLGRLRLFEQPGGILAHVGEAARDRFGR
jgi:hypothetical protein